MRIRIETIVIQFYAWQSLERIFADSRQFYVVEVNRVRAIRAHRHLNDTVRLCNKQQPSLALNNDGGVPILSVNFSHACEMRLNAWHHHHPTIIFKV